jgi:hypothetical protein
MAVNVLYDLKEDMAVLYCSTTDWAFGPVFYGNDADEKALAFRTWFDDGSALKHAHTIGIKPYGLLGADGDDPRDYSEHDLGRLYTDWQNIACDADGDLIDEPQAVAP